VKIVAKSGKPLTRDATITNRNKRRDRQPRHEKKNTFAKKKKKIKPPE